jgi:hypothetical protein
MDPRLATGEEVIILLDVGPRGLPLRIRIDTMSKPDTIIGRRPPRHFGLRIGTRVGPRTHCGKKSL